MKKKIETSSLALLDFPLLFILFFPGWFQEHHSKFCGWFRKLNQDTYDYEGHEPCVVWSVLFMTYETSVRMRRRKCKEFGNFLKIESAGTEVVLRKNIKNIFYISIYKNFTTTFFFYLINTKYT